MQRQWGIALVNISSISFIRNMYVLCIMDTPDEDAPYGRKPNGEPYKTKPKARLNNNAYNAKNREKCKAITNKWNEENPERVKELKRLYAARKRLELAYYKQLVFETIESM